MSAQKNIVLLFIIKVAKWFMLYMPVSLLFYLENGLEDHYFLLHAIYSGVIAFFEVPSGYIADVWGRKKALVFGALLGTLGFGAYSISYSLTGFLIAEILLGLGSSLLSGADTAILYDSLKERGKEKEYLKIEGRITAVGNISEALAGIFVSVIVFGFYRNYFVLQTVLTFIAFVTALFLKEPKVHVGERQAGFKDILNIVSVSFRKNKVLRNFIYFSAVIGFASLSMAWLAQYIFVAASLEEKHFGYAWVALNTMVAIGSLLAMRIDNLLKLNKSLIYLTIFLTLGFVIIGINISLLAFVPMALLFFVRGTSHPILKNYINQNTESSQRATVLSLRSLLIRIMFFMMGPILQYIINNLSLAHALFLCALTVFIPGTIITIFIMAGKRVKL